MNSSAKSVSLSVRSKQQSIFKQKTDFNLTNQDVKYSGYTKSQSKIAGITQNASG